MQWVSNLVLENLERWIKPRIIHRLEITIVECCHQYKRAVKLDIVYNGIRFTVYHADDSVEYAVTECMFIASYRIACINLLMPYSELE